MGALNSSARDSMADQSRNDRLHTAMLVLITYWAFALIVDTRHHAFEGFRIESFLILEHLPFYAGWGLICLALGVHYLQSLRLGLPLRERLPAGYWLAALGAMSFGVGGLLDFAWHEAFGFEQNLAVAWSPSHLILAVSEAVVSLGVLRYSLQQPGRVAAAATSFTAALPITIPIAEVLWSAMWTTWYSDPITADFASGGAVVGALDAYNHVEYMSAAAQIAGTLGMLWSVAIVTPVIVLALSRWRLPVGSVTVIVSFYALIKAATVDGWVYLLAIVGGAVLTDVAWGWIRETRRDASRTAYIALAVLLPVSQAMLYFGIVATQTSGLIWAVHLWSGVIAMSGLVGAWFGFLVICGVHLRAREPAAVESAEVPNPLAPTPAS